MMIVPMPPPPLPPGSGSAARRRRRRRQAAREAAAAAALAAAVLDVRAALSRLPLHRGGLYPRLLFERVALGERRRAGRATGITITTAAAKTISTAVSVGSGAGRLVDRQPVTRREQQVRMLGDAPAPDHGDAPRPPRRAQTASCSEPVEAARRRGRASRARRARRAPRAITSGSPGPGEAVVDEAGAVGAQARSTPAGARAPRRPRRRRARSGRSALEFSASPAPASRGPGRRRRCRRRWRRTAPRSAAAASPVQLAVGSPLPSAGTSPEAIAPTTVPMKNGVSTEEIAKTGLAWPRARPSITLPKAKPDPAQDDPERRQRERDVERASSPPRTPRGNAVQSDDQDEDQPDVVRLPDRRERVLDPGAHPIGVLRRARRAAPRCPAPKSAPPKTA